MSEDAIPDGDELPGLAPEGAISYTRADALETLDATANEELEELADRWERRSAAADSIDHAEQLIECANDQKAVIDDE